MARAGRLQRRKAPHRRHQPWRSKSCPCLWPQAFVRRRVRANRSRQPLTKRRFRKRRGFPRPIPLSERMRPGRKLKRWMMRGRPRRRGARPRAKGIPQRAPCRPGRAINSESKGEGDEVCHNRRHPGWSRRELGIYGPGGDVPRRPDEGRRDDWRRGPDGEESRGGMLQL